QEGSASLAEYQIQEIFSFSEDKTYALALYFFQGTANSCPKSYFVLPTTSPASTSHPTQALASPHTAAGQYPLPPWSTQNSIFFRLGNLSECIETAQGWRRPSDSPRHAPEVF